MKVPDQQPSLKKDDAPPPAAESEAKARVTERRIAEGALMHRRPGTRWSVKELAAFKLTELDRCAAADFEDQLTVMGRYYRAKISREQDIRRRDLLTLLNNWTGELDRARAYARARNDGYTKR